MSTLFRQPLSLFDVVFLVLVCALCQPFMAELKLLAEQSPPYTYLSAHFVHINWTHFALDMACAGFIPLLLPVFTRRLFWLSTLMMSVCISILLVHAGQLQAAQLSSYVGFSGVLHGLYILGSVMVMVSYVDGFAGWHDTAQKITRSETVLSETSLQNKLPQNKPAQTTHPKKDYLFWQSVIIFIGTIGKVVYDLLAKPTHTAELISAAVAFDAHLDGLVTGLGFFGIFFAMSWLSNRIKNSPF